MPELTLYGVIASPYVRKVRLALAAKGLSYSQVPVMPGGEQPQEFIANSPLGKIPLLRTGDDWISDSSVICAYLEREDSQCALLPSDNLGAARAEWFEEYADSHMVPIVAGHLFAEVVLAKPLFKREPLQSDIDAATQVEIPAIFDYLEGQLSRDYLVGDSLSLADIAVCGVFVNMHHSKFSCDASRWPKVAAYIERVHGSDLFASLIAEEEAFLAQVLGA